jgi:hypothetical protein
MLPVRSMKWEKPAKLYAKKYGLQAATAAGRYSQSRLLEAQTKRTTKARSHKVKHQNGTQPKYSSSCLGDLVVK